MHFSEPESEMVRDVDSSWVLYLQNAIQKVGQQGDAVAYLVYRLPQLFDPFKKIFSVRFFF